LGVEFLLGFLIPEAEGFFSLRRIRGRRHISPSVRSYLAFVAFSLPTQLPYGPVSLVSLMSVGRRHYLALL